MYTSKIIGREQELTGLEALYFKKESHIVVLYGRRRIGKSFFVEHFMQDKLHLHFEGLEHLSTKEQIQQFTKDLIAQIKDPLLKKINFKNWNDIFDYLTIYLQKPSKKVVLFFDEFQWMAAGQTKIVSLLKKYWDQEWKKQSCLLILCGSIATFMVKKVIRSSALYGRISLEISLGPLTPSQTAEFLKPPRSLHEILIYNLTLGGIPKYWEELSVRKSALQNLNDLYFKKTGYLFNDFEKVFYSQFKEHATYAHIVRILQNPLSLDEIAKKIKTSSGGGLKFYLDNLESAQFIASYVPYDKNMNSKLKKYRLIDEPLRFYFKFVEPYKKLILQNSQKNLFNKLTHHQWEPWLGLALENFCLKNALLLAENMDFGENVLNYGPHFQQGNQGFQIDLLFQRSDKVVTLCEIKFQNKPISTSVVAEVERKCQLLKMPRGHTLEKALICVNGIDESLKQLNYFHHVLDIMDLFKKPAKTS